MTRLLCRVLGHQLEPARRVAVTPAFDGGRPIYETCDPADSRGTLCPRCGSFAEHPWVNDARLLTGREP